MTTAPETNVVPFPVRPAFHLTRLRLVDPAEVDPSPASRRP